MGKNIHKGRFVDFMGYKFYRDHTEILDKKDKEKEIFSFVKYLFKI